MSATRIANSAEGGALAVNQISFDVSAGAILGLVGPNGSGKTTTMRCLCGILPPDQGVIMVAGHNMALDPISAKRQLAFVPSEASLFDYLSVREHLAFFARLYECGDRRAEAEALIERLDLSEKANRLPGALSRGMKQKLMIACALIHDPKVLILDEPFTGLDPYAIRAIRDLLRERIDQGATVMVSSHLLAMVEGMVDQVLIIREGKRVAMGSREELQQGLPQLEGKADLESIFMHFTGDGDNLEAAAAQIERESAEPKA